MFIAVAIHVLVTIILYLDPKYSVVSYVMAPAVLANFIGMLMIRMGHFVAGARVFLVSSVIFVPIGIIGALGARKIIDEEKRKDFYN